MEYAPESMVRLLKNYQDLVTRVDTHIQRVETRYKQHIACQKGCDDCCRPLSLFPVEALALSLEFNALPPAKQAAAEKNLADQDRCPLLKDHECLLYGARPVICRTHGFPIFMAGKDNRATVDFCPKNFTGMTGFPREMLLDLDQLNTTLAAVNRLFLQAFDTPFPHRIPVSKALFLVSG